MTDLRKIIIDGREIEADPALTIIQVCDQNGIEIPRFCYHERLSIAGARFARRMFGWRGIARRTLGAFERARSQYDRDAIDTTV